MDTIKNNRIFVYDLMRVIAAFAVILIHTASYVINIYSPYSLNFVVANVFDAASRFAVPFFLMISGIFMLDEKKALPNEKLIKKVLKVAGLLFFWTLFYIVVTPEKTLFQHLKFGHMHLWFLRTLLGLYLMTPIFRLFVKKRNQNYILYLMGLTLIFQSLPKILDAFFFHKEFLISVARSFNVAFAAPWVLYYLAGWLIVLNMKTLGKYVNMFRLLAILMFSITFGAMQCLHSVLFKANSVFYIDSNIIIFFYSISLFILCLYYVKKYEKKLPDTFKTIVFKMSELTFGVYVWHFFILNLIRKYVSIVDYNIFIYFLIMFVSCSVLSYLVTYLCSKIRFLKYLVKF